MTTGALGAAAGLGARGRLLRGGAILLPTALSASIFFQEGFVALFAAWGTAEYSHGPLIPVLSMLLFLRQLKETQPHVGAVDDRWPGLLFVAASLCLALIGKIARIPDVVAYALIGFIGGMVLVSFGWRRGLRYWPGVLHLVFMLPLPGLLYWKISTTLQYISSELGVALIAAMGISVFLDGNIIDLGVYKLHVAEACSGLRYLFPILSFSYVFACLYRGPDWHKMVLLLSAAPITVLMNSARIGLIGVIVNSYGIEHAEGLTHLLEGWVIFVTCVLLLFSLARFMLWLQPTKMSLQEALDLDFDGLGAQFSRIRLIQASPALLLAVGVTLAGAILWHIGPQRSSTPMERTPLALMPSVIGDWNLGITERLEPKIARVLAADDYLAATFQHETTAANIDFFVAWYADQTRGGIHSPEVCLPAGGWEMADIRHIDIADRLGISDSFPINRAIIQKGETRLLVYYWFEQYGGRQSSDMMAKLALLRDAVRYGRSDGALVRIITPISPGEGAEQAEARLLDFTRPLIGELGRFVPRHMADSGSDRP